MEEKDTNEERKEGMRGVTSKVTSCSPTLRRHQGCRMKGRVVMRAADNVSTEVIEEAYAACKTKPSRVTYDTQREREMSIILYFFKHNA